MEVSENILCLQLHCLYDASGPLAKQDSPTKPVLDTIQWFNVVFSSDRSCDRFTGKPVSTTTGLYYYGARWYDPAVGRFISEDSDAGRRSNPQTLNSYTYVVNNPLNYVDPWGETECEFSDIGCLGANVWSAGVNWWNGLDPDSQQLLSLTAMIALTVVTGGAAAPALLLVGGIGFGIGVGAYLGYTYATGGTATLSGALTWGIAGFTIATIAYSIGGVVARGGLTAGERLAANRAAGLGFEEKVAKLFGYTRNVGAGRAALEGVETAGKAVPDFATEILREAKFVKGLFTTPVR